MIHFQFVGAEKGKNNFEYPQLIDFLLFSNWKNQNTTVEKSVSLTIDMSYLIPNLKKI